MLVLFKFAKLFLCLGGGLLAGDLALVGSLQLPSNGPDSSSMVDTGTVLIEGHSAPFRVRTLPINSFPELPDKIADQLRMLGCSIPQTYESHRPENVIHGSLQRPGSKDWAVLCSIKGRVSLLVFLEGDSFAEPTRLSQAMETERLQIHGSTEELGFNWGIDIATPRQVHDAQAGMTHRPPSPGHDSIADSIVDRRTVYRFYNESEWRTLVTE